MASLKLYYLCSWILSVCFFITYCTIWKAKEKAVTAPYRNVLCLNNKSFQIYACQKICHIFCLFILFFFHCSKNNMFGIEPAEQMVAMCPSHQGMKMPESNPFLPPIKIKSLRSNPKCHIYKSVFFFLQRKRILTQRA